MPGRRKGVSAGAGGGDTHYAVRLLVHAARATRQNPEPAYAGYSYWKMYRVCIVWRVT